jgi:hypothetical protein
VTTATHHGSHRELIDRVRSTALVPSQKVDAIIVPSARYEVSIGHAAGLAEALDCQLVVLSSKHSQAPKVVKYIIDREVDVDVTAIDFPANPVPGLPVLETSTVLAGTRLQRKADTSAKRNLGLVLSRLAGWQSVLFLDDDIAVPDPADIGRAAALLTDHYGVGLHVGGYPDNSVVCHAHRETGGWQETFIGGGALVVPPQEITSFFPEIYNEDWFFLLGDAGLRPVAQEGQAVQRPYDPFANPERARQEEFGDDLAEGIFALLDDGKQLGDATPRYWRQFLAHRLDLINDIIDRTRKADLTDPRRDQIIVALKAARGRLHFIEPAQCTGYLAAWQADGDKWRAYLDGLSATGLAAGLRALGLKSFRPLLVGA